jgi:hypothetical protein
MLNIRSGISSQAPGAPRESAGVSSKPGAAHALIGLEN